MQLIYTAGYCSKSDPRFLFFLHISSFSSLFLSEAMKKNLQMKVRQPSGQMIQEQRLTLAPTLAVPVLKMVCFDFLPQKSPIV